MTAKLKRYHQGGCAHFIAVSCSRRQLFLYSPSAALMSRNYTIYAWGNLTNKAQTKCTAENLNESVGPDNRFTGGGRYDAAGNMISGSAYVFDAENRITSAGGAQYTYDGDGNRVRKTGTGEVLYWMGAGSESLSESGSTGSITSDYIFFGGKRVARFDFSNSTAHYYISDHLGSATVVAGAAGMSESEEMYFPYGGERWTWNDPNIPPDPNHYKFTGKERDTETGLDYFGARYYGSNMGRFSSPDPGPYILRDPQTWNRYTYTRNNPLTFVDPNGMYFVVPANQGTFKSWVSSMLKSPQGAALVRRLAGDSRPITLKLGGLSSDNNRPHPGNTKPISGNSPGPVLGATVTIDPAQLNDAAKVKHRNFEQQGTQTLSHELDHADALLKASTLQQGLADAANQDRTGAADAFGDEVLNESNKNPNKVSDEDANAEAQKLLNPDPPKQNDRKEPEEVPGMCTADRASCDR